MGTCQHHIKVTYVHVTRVKGIADLAQQYLAAIAAVRGGEGDADTDAAGGIVELGDARGRWRVAVAAGRGGLGAGGDPTSVSFVNGIWTPRGGTHLKYVVDQVVEALHAYIRKTFKDIDVSERQVHIPRELVYSLLIVCADQGRHT